MIGIEGDKWIERRHPNLSRKQMPFRAASAKNELPWEMPAFYTESDTAHLCHKRIFRYNHETRWRVFRSLFR